jgi:RNA polymerase sigma factor (sigma-70 family)
MEFSPRALPSSDEELASHAQEGDLLAFEHLILRHRSAALRWATAVSRDIHLAEDIVQDASLLALTKLHTLADCRRFVPWLRRIVRNEALMHVRRGGPYRKESPLNRMDEASEGVAGSPEQETLLQEESMLATRLIHSLNPKERAVCEAYYLTQLTPQAIAAAFGMTTAHVYTVLSRGRSRMQQHHYQELLTRYLNERRQVAALPSWNALPDLGMYLEECWDTFSLYVLHAVHSAGRTDLSMADIMGLTGQAFRLIIDECSADRYWFNQHKWARSFAKGLRHLGIHARWFGENNRDPVRQHFRLEALSFIQHTIDRGYPILIWGVQEPFFGWISGYDDHKRALLLSGVFGHTEMPYEQLGMDSGSGSELFLLTVGSTFKPNPLEALRGALTDIVQHARGLEPLPCAGIRIGLSGYDVWRELLEKGQGATPGMRLLAWSISSNRQYAASFLQRAADRLPMLHDEFGEAMAQLARQAAGRYGQIADTTRQLRPLFPFNLLSPPCSEQERTNQAIQLLEHAKQLEIEAIADLEALLDLMQRVDRTVHASDVSDAVLDNR